MRGIGCGDHGVLRRARGREDADRDAVSGELSDTRDVRWERRSVRVRRYGREFYERESGGYGGREPRVVIGVNRKLREESGSFKGGNEQVKGLFGARFYSR